MIDCEYVFGLLATDGSVDEVELVNRIADNKCIVAASSYTDGTYALVGEYASTSELMSIGTHLRSLESVKRVEMHTILVKRGGKMELNSLHLRVLLRLVDDPRMPIVEIAKRAGMTARRVRRLLQEIEESKAINFGIKVELGAASGIPFLLKFSYNQSKIHPKAFEEWLWEHYPLPLWEVYLSASEPIALALFAVDYLNELDAIVREIRDSEFIDKVRVTISTHHKYFLGQRHRRLLEAVKYPSRD
jgi:DNA-binding Lrp family transcriptional regulator